MHEAYSVCYSVYDLHDLHAQVTGSGSKVEVGALLIHGSELGPS